MATLTLIRHGETQANLDGVWHGSTDTPLTERGLAQAQRVAGWAADACRDAVALYSSPLQRARRTAEAVAAGLGRELCLDPDLAEYDLGNWEGKSYAALYEEHQLWQHMKRDPDFAPHGGESPREVTERFSGALLRIGAAHRGQRVIVVTHGGALSMGLAHLLDGDYTAWGKVMDNCAVSELEVYPRPSMTSFNQTDHLEGI